MSHGLLRVFSLGALTVVPLGQVHIGFGVAGAAVALTTGVLALRSRDWPTVRVASMTLLIAAFGSIGIPFAIWFVVVAFWLASRWLPQLVPDIGWLPRGRATPVVWGLTGALVIFAGIGLTLWALGTDQMGESTIQLLEAAQDLPGPALATALVVFIVVNAVTEEIAYRGIVFDAAGSVFGPKPAVIAQAIAFGTLHVAGFPAGPVGVGLAFGYGLTLGTVRHLTGGLQFPIIAHMAADTTIAILFVVLLLR